MADPVEGLIWEIRRTFRALAVAAERAMTPLGIPAGERALLEFLAREQNPVSPAQLARQYNVSRQHIHQSLNRLPRPEWVERLPDPKDARSVLLRLSPRGRRFWARIQVQDRQALQRLGRSLDPLRLRAATETLSALRQELEKGLVDDDN